jgi:hypothetical protein
MIRIFHLDLAGVLQTDAAMNDAVIDNVDRWITAANPRVIDNTDSIDGSRRHIPVSSFYLRASW